MSVTYAFAEEDFTETLLINTLFIKKLYFRLKARVARNLATVVKDMDAFHEYILKIFSAGSSSIPRANTVQEIVRLLTENSYWKFLDVSNLEEIVSEFGGDLEEECMKLINKYKEDLNGYKTAIRIAEFIEQNNKENGANVNGGEEYASLKEDTGKYDANYRTKLSIKLETNPSRKIHLESLCTLKNFGIHSVVNSTCHHFHTSWTAS